MGTLKRAAADAGLAIGERKKTYNSRLAQELGKWAETENKGEAFHNSVFQAYFVHGKNIAKIPILKELAESVGLSAERALEVLSARKFKEAVDQDWLRSYQLGIHSVPTFKLNEKHLVGAQPYEELQKFMISNRIPQRTAKKS